MSDRYTTPEAGTVDWHNPLNENFNKLDADVELRDVESNLGDYTPAAGAKFLATDTGRRFIGDGSNWTEVAIAAPSVAADDSTAATGQLWYNTSDDTLRISTEDTIIDIT